MKTNLIKYIEQVSSGFQSNKGRASVYCFPPISYGQLIVSLIQQYYIKSPGEQVFIVVDSFATRKAILDCIAKCDKVEFNVKILSKDYIKTNYKYQYRFAILVGINDDLAVINHISSQCKFVLAILTRNNMNNAFTAEVRHLLPAINTTVSDISVRSDSIYSPVEENRIGIDLTPEDRELYDKYSEYVSTSISIFGDVANIEKCKYGDPSLNISGSEYREGIARENGWNSEIDTSNDWGKRIDEVYNPNTLFERANNFFNITKQRKDLLTDNAAKIEHIIRICLDHKDKKILIVSKRGEFAANITKYINGVFEETKELVCGDYHDCIDKAILYDSATGLPILIKSGKNKGQPKEIGAQAISTLNMREFNNSAINVLSIKNSSDIKLEIAVDVVIYTSAFIDDIMALKTRFTNVTFNGVPTKLYKVYCKGTIENKHLLNQKESPLIEVIDDVNNFNIGYDETTGDIIL